MTLFPHSIDTFWVIFPDVWFLLFIATPEGYLFILHFGNKRHRGVMTHMCRVTQSLRHSHHQQNWATREDMEVSREQSPARPQD